MPRYSDKQITDALIKSGGMVYVAAKSMNCAPDTIKARIAKSPKLRAVRDAESEIVLDNAETRLADAIENGEPWAIQFVLKTKGKSRGYTDESNVKHEGIIRVVYDDGS